MASTDDDAAIFEWSLRLMTEAFCDLAGNFAEVDADLAEAAIHDIEERVARTLAAFREEQAKRVGPNAVNAILKLVVPPFREMTQSARAMIQKVGKPEH